MTRLIYSLTKCILERLARARITPGWNINNRINIDETGTGF